MSESELTAPRQQVLAQFDALPYQEDQHAQDVQKNLAEAQEKYFEKEFQGIAGEGKVLIDIIKFCCYKVRKVNIDLELKRNEEKKTVEYLVKAAFNDAIKKAEDNI